MNKIRNIAFIVLLLATFVACKTAKDIVKPEAPLPVGYRNASSTDTTTIAAIKWDAFFADPTLQQLLTRAIANNYDMQLAVKNIEVAQLLLKQTRWSYLPDARLQVTASSNRPSGNSLNGLSSKSFLGTTHIEDYSANIALSWEADIWGKIKKQKTGALAAYLQTEEARKWVQTNLRKG